jgi:hypothetical protein
MEPDSRHCLGEVAGTAHAPASEYVQPVAKNRSGIGSSVTSR